jgi:imidazolonepropionase-like amidohydrolase
MRSLEDLHMKLKTIATTLLMIAACLATFYGQQSGATIFEGARLIVGDGSAAIENSAFVVQNGKFTAVGRRGQVQPPAGASRVDLSGKTVMPALINLHTHPGWNSFKTVNSAEMFSRENMIEALQRYAYYGVAAITSMGIDKGEVAYELRANPVAGAALLRTAGLGMALPKGGPQGSRVDVPYGVSNEAEARKAVKELAAKKVDFVKIWVDDRGGTVKILPPEIYRHIIDEAHKNNLRVVAHIFALSDAKELLRSGIDGFMHSVRDKDVDDEFLQMIKAKPNVFLVPNLPDRGVTEDNSWMSGTVIASELARMKDADAKRTPEQTKRLQDTFGIQARNLKRLTDAGMLIGFGEDGPGTGYTAHQELADMVAAGMTPAQAITAATRNAAQILRLTDYGTIANGKSASFLALDANPLESISNTRKISRVYLQGAELNRAKLGGELTGGNSR